jgi:acyl carrier protein
VHPLLGRAVSIGSRRAVFEAQIAAKPPWVDHRIMGSTVFPAAGYLEMAARGFAAANGAPWQSVALRNVIFERPLVLRYGKSRKVTLTLESRGSNGGAGESSFAISAIGDGATERYCQGRAVAAGERGERLALQAELARMKSQVQIGQFYGDARKVGFEYGANFSTVRELWLGQPNSGEAIGRLTASPAPDAPEDHPFRHSSVVDGALQVIRAAGMTLEDAELRGTFVPASIKSVTMARELPFQVWTHVTVRANVQQRSILASVRLINDAGEVLASIEDMDLRQIARLSLARGAPAAALAAKVERVFTSREELIKRLGKLPPREQVGVVSKWLIQEVKDILGQAAEQIDLDNLDPSTAFMEIGLDSLLVTELQRRIQEKLEFRFKTMQALDYQSIESLAEYILSEVLSVGPVTAAVAATATAEAHPAAN